MHCGWVNNLNCQDGIKRTVLSPIEFFGKNKAGSIWNTLILTILMSRIFKLMVIAKNRCSGYRSYRPILVNSNNKISQNGWIYIIKLYYRWNLHWACIASKYSYTKCHLPISISKCWPTDNPLLQVYINLYTGTKNRYWWYFGYMHVPVPKD